MILDRIVEKKRLRLKKLNLDIKLLKEKAKRAGSRPSFIEALKKEGLSIIGEVKRASPSKGLIKENFDPLKLAVEYERCVDAVSVLTEESFFLGNPEYLKEITGEIKIPVLRKDFIIDEAQIYEAKILGASAILLITAILDEKILKKFIKITEGLGMDALVEVHTKEEVETALRAGAQIIGINNRDLKTFEVDLDTTVELAKWIPKDKVIVSESGIKDEVDIKKLTTAGIGGVLIGEVFMRCDDITSLAEGFKGAAREKRVTKIKICGLRRVEDVEMVNKNLPDYVGFIFAESKRKITKEKAKELIDRLDRRIKTVGVFVDEKSEDVEKIAKYCGLDILQFHGEERTEYCDQFREQYEVWKAFSVKERRVEESLLKYKDHTELCLLDAYNKGVRGGSGKVFNWDLIEGISEKYKIALAGGITSKNILEAVEKVDPYIIDLSSGVETDGFKDGEKIKEIIQKIRRGGEDG